MLIFTTAGTEYDYGHTNEVARVIVQEQRNESKTEPLVLRVVNVVDENEDRERYLATYQADRYRSGMNFTTEDPDEAGEFLQLCGGRGVTALLRGYAGTSRLCDECGEELHPTFDPPGPNCGSCREARDRSMREWKIRHDPNDPMCEGCEQPGSQCACEGSRAPVGTCHICGEPYGSGTLCACEREARADAAQ